MFHSLTAAPLALNTNGLVSYLKGLVGPLFLGIVGIVALFFLFTGEISRFVQLVVLAAAIAVILYTPSNGFTSSTTSGCQCRCRLGKSLSSPPSRCPASRCHERSGDHGLSIGMWE